MSRRLLLIRTIVLATALLGVNYVAWRWFASVSWSSWWIAVPLVLAETYSLIDSLLFGFGMLRLRERGQPPDAPEGLTVDVFITTYNEPLELVERTAVAACAIRYPHRTWILDDGNREEMRELAQRLDVGWITRSADWAGHARHAKAGNLNNALLATDGEFLLILDADQVPSPEILHRTLGYFGDEGMALVQTPQWFENVPDHDPLGSQAPLFYGPIQQSKDGWNSAYFCGSNAVLRREALMLLGVSGYVGEVELGVQRALSTARTVVRRALRGLGPEDVMVRDALEAIEYEVGKARRRLGRGEALFDVTYRFQARVAAVRRRLVAADLEALHADLAVIAELDGIAADPDLGLATIDEGALRQMSQRDFSPLGAVDAVEALVRAVDVDRGEEAQAVMPMATISVTEDMATCMRLHALGWRTAYHDEVLAVGLAPEDLQTMLTQRLRWAQGTIQVMLRENPLTQRGLNLAQRLMYFGTMWSYLAGFAALIYIAAPVLYLVFGVLPVQAFSADFFWRLVPFLLVNQLLFLVVADGRPTWRGQQYSLALFPVWIRSVTSAVGNVWFGRSLDFAVTPKTRQTRDSLPWHLVKPQLWAMAILLGGAVIGVVRLVAGQAEPLATGINLFWVAFDLLVFSVMISAVRYRGFDPAVHGRPTPPRGSSDAPDRADPARVAGQHPQHDRQHTDQTQGVS